MLVCLLGLIIFGLALTLWFKAPSEFSESERRPLAQFPTLSTDTLTSGKFMDNFEDYALDQLPLREKFRNLKALAAKYFFRMSDVNGIYITEDGYTFKLDYPLNEDSVEHALSVFQSISDRYLDESNKVFISVIPDKGYYIADEHGLPSMDYEKLFAMISEQEGMEYIDISGALSLESFYKTDTHWRQELIFAAAEKLAAGLGAQIDSNLTVNELDNDFYGVYYGQSALPLSSEKIFYCTSDVLDSCVVTSYDSGKAEQISVYDMEKAFGKDPYEMFLSGSLSLLTIENPTAESGKELIIFRDSFGSSIAPLLASGYSKITLVDIRYIPSVSLGSLVDFDGADVLFLYSSMVLNSSDTLK